MPRSTTAPTGCWSCHRPARPTCGGYYETAAAAAGDVPVLAYHYPQTSPPGIPVELPELPVQGVKDSSGDRGRLLAELTGYNGWLYVGSSAVLSLAGPLGCSGAVLALAGFVYSGS